MSHGAVGTPAARQLARTGAGPVRPLTSRRQASSFVLVTDPLPPTDPRARPPSGRLLDDPALAALRVKVRDEHGVWIGRESGPVTDRVPNDHQRPLRIPPDEADAFDLGQSRGAIWPLYHDLAGSGVYQTRWRRAYRSVNATYAKAAAEEAAPGGTVWVDDYRLQLVPRLLRRLRPDVRIGFYLHTPFPPADLMRRMPSYPHLLAGLLGADLLGFQTANAAENFLRLSQDLTDTPPNVGVYPVGPDSTAIRRLAVRPDVLERANALRRSLGDPSTVILSINTADQSQGVERRLLGLEQAFRTRQLRAREVAMIQIVLGSTADLDQSTGDGIARAVARVNGKYATVGRPRIHYLVASPDLAERVALYLATDLLLATPLREGASVPALEFVSAARSRSTLLLSEFSGTANVLPDAHIVNPYDDEAVRTGLARALATSPDERAKRMRAMRDYVLGYDNHLWAAQFLAALTSGPRPAGGPSKRDQPAPRRWPRSHLWLNLHNADQP